MAESGGASGRKVVMYGLSTCVWCRKMREYLESESVDFEVVYVDKLEGEDRNEALAVVGKWNPATSFPTVVIDDETSVNGYKPDRVKEILGL
jgi:glutaredoxin